MKEKEGQNRRTTVGAEGSMIMSQQKRVQMGKRRDLGHTEALFQIKNCIIIAGVLWLISESLYRERTCL